MKKIVMPELMVLKYDLRKAIEDICEKSTMQLLEESGLGRFLLYIDDQVLLDQTIEVFTEAELNFWVSPASLRHHPIDERGVGGLVIHTNRVCAMALELCDIYDIEMGSDELHHIIMGCLFHDICKGSISSTQFEWSPDGKLNVDHPYIGYEFLKGMDVPIEVCDAVRWHHGKWGMEPGEKEITDFNRVELIVHLADKLAAVEDMSLLRGWSP
jgi:putative nucleotidyltransferase with HDIG domain